MKFRVVLMLHILIISSSASASQTGPFTSQIKQMQVKDVGNPYNTVHLVEDITTSPCASTNQFDRFTITNNVQHSTILAALMANKTITIYGKGAPCNSANIEEISDIRISP